MSSPSFSTFPVLVYGLGTSWLNRLLWELPSWSSCSHAFSILTHPLHYCTVPSPWTTLTMTVLLNANIKSGRSFHIKWTPLNLESMTLSHRPFLLWTFSNGDFSCHIDFLTNFNCWWAHSLTWLFSLSLCFPIGRPLLLDFLFQRPDYCPLEISILISNHCE